MEARNERRVIVEFGGWDVLGKGGVRGDVGCWMDVGCWSFEKSRQPFLTR